MDIELVTDSYTCMMYIVSLLAGMGGGILWRPPAYSLFDTSERAVMLCGWEGDNMHIGKNVRVLVGS